MNIPLLRAAEALMSSREDVSSVFSEMALLARGYQLSKMLQVAVTLDLAGRVHSGPQSAESLAVDAGADATMLLRLCRALAGFGIFTIDADGLIGQTERSRCLRRDAQPSLYHAVRYWTVPHLWAAWGNLERL